MNYEIREHDLWHMIWIIEYEIINYELWGYCGLGFTNYELWDVKFEIWNRNYEIWNLEPEIWDYELWNY